MLPKHDAIGEVRLPVCQMDLAQAKEIWKDLSSIVGDGKVSPQTNKAISWIAYFYVRFYAKEPTKIELNFKL